MVAKQLMVILALSVLLVGENTFKKHCVECHEQLDISLHKTYMNALLVYGGRANMKAGLTYYFRAPHGESSVMDEDFLRNVGVKSALKISDQNLSKALDTYWEKYTVMGKLH